MKLSELILELHTEMLNRGNLDVYIQDEYGPLTPEVYFRHGDGLEPEGIYLN